MRGLSNPKVALYEWVPVFLILDFFSFECSDPVNDLE